MSDDKNGRYRFSVPLADDKVVKWIESQNNLGFSLRTLIKAAVSNWGYQDVTCIALGSEVKRRGRPPKSASHYSDVDSQVDLFGAVSADETDEGSAPEGIIEENRAETPVPAAGKATTTPVKNDDDGFADPESLFNN